MENALSEMQAETTATYFALHAIIRTVFADPAMRARHEGSAITDFEEYIEETPDSPARDEFRRIGVDQIRRLFRDAP